MEKKTGKKKVEKINIVSVYAGVAIPFVICLFFAIIGYRAANRNLDKMQIITGTIQVEAGAKDTDLGIEFDSPVVLRSMEMLQYVKDDYRENVVNKEYSKSRVSVVQTENKNYYNPSFPNLKQDAYYFGKATMNGIELSEEVLKKFTFSSYIYFAGRYDGIAVNLPEKFQNNTSVDLVSCGSTIETTDSKSEVGHVKIYYTTGEPKSEMVYSIYGEVEDGVIGKSGICYVYDKEISPREIENQNMEFRRSNRKVGVVFTWICAALLIIPTIIIIVNRVRVGSES